MTTTIVVSVAAAQIPGGRAYRSTNKCVTCSVYLCVRLQPGQRNGCWSLGHETRALTEREGTLAQRNRQMGFASRRQEIYKRRRRRDNSLDIRSRRWQCTDRKDGTNLCCHSLIENVA